MNQNWIGPVSALAAFFGIWLGHVAVRRIEFVAPDIRLPALIAGMAGVLLELSSFLVENLALSAALGILGVTLLWDGLEFRRQQNRVKKGHAPANPANPRHLRILRDYPTATTVDWLARNPLGRKWTDSEIAAIKEMNG